MQIESIEEYLVHIGGRIWLNAHEVAYFEACSNYTLVHLHADSKIIVATNLGKIEDRVTELGLFFRPRRGLMVNAQFVKSFDMESILLHNALKIDVPRRKRQRVYSHLSSLIQEQ